MMKIGLLGHGVVGTGVTRIIDAGKTDETAQLCVRRILVKDEAEKKEDRETVNYADILEDEEITTVVECMGGLEPAHTYLMNAINHGKNVVTSNKKMLAAFFDELMSAAEENGVQVLYEATTGGGIPWICSLNDIRRIDEVFSFRGIFNGTTNYILSAMKEKQAGFDDVLKEAQQLGYAERNPSDDIDGYDVRYKTVLSSAAAFDAVLAPAEVPAFGIRFITKEDMEYAKASSRTIKLIGQGRKTARGVSACVMPVMLKENDYLSRISSNINAIECTSETLGTAGFVGQGAGSLPTAHAVVQDLIRLEQGQKKKERYLAACPVDNSREEGVFYIRTGRPECFREVLDQKISDHALLTRKVPLVEILEQIASSNDAELFVSRMGE